MRTLIISSLLALTGCKSPLVVKDYLNMVAISPGHGATDVAVDVQVIAGFSEALVASSVNAQNAYLTDDAANPVIATATYEAGAHWIVIAPEAALSPNTNYVVTFGAEITGEVSGALLAPVQTQFTTAGTHPSNALPLADAGDDHEVAAGATVSIDGSASSDFEGAILSFSWRLVSSPANSDTALESETGAIITVRPDVEGQYIVGLTVNDGVQDSSEDFVVIKALGTTPPPDTGEAPDLPDTGSFSDTGTSR
jgi:hypothetical protein